MIIVGEADLTEKMVRQISSVKSVFFSRPIKNGHFLQQVGPWSKREVTRMTVGNVLLFLELD